MEMKDFLERISKAKKSQKLSNCYNLVLQKYKGMDNSSLLQREEKEREIFFIKDKSSDSVCSKCGHKLNQMMLRVSFNDEQEHLTIFESGLLFMVWVFHKCEAGRRFIDNIREVRRI